MRGIGGRTLDVDDKRALLLDSAERTFCRLGYARTTIDALARDAGVTRPTVYAYFASKDEVFRALADRVRTEILALQERLDVSSPVAAMRTAFAEFLDRYVRHHGMLVVIAHQALSDPAMRELRAEIVDRAHRRHTRFLRRLAEAGLVELTIPADAVVEAMTGVVMRFADLAAAEPARLPALRDELFAVYLRLTGLRDPD